MAFYSRSINDVGDEIEQTKSSTSARCFENAYAMSDRESFTSRDTSSLGGTYSRYVNPAVCISKTETDIENLSEVSQSTIPPLDLNLSGETMPSTESVPVVSFQKSCDANAFNEWLSGKKRLKSYEAAKQRQIQEERQRELKARKKLAEEKYQEWLAEKTKPKVKPLPKTELQQYQKVCSSRDDSESNRRAWEEKKIIEQRRKREQLLKAKEQQNHLEEKRKLQSSRAWQMWIAEAPLKPKPVPLNKGFLSLKGTISDIYINPNPWREPFE